MIVLSALIQRIKEVGINTEKIAHSAFFQNIQRIVAIRANAPGRNRYLTPGEISGSEDSARYLAKSMPTVDLIQLPENVSITDAPTERDGAEINKKNADSKVKVL